jgi:tRNA threonylcarbamoyladenosine biosynthesis protein TsaE
MQFELADPVATEEFGARLAHCCGESYRQQLGAERLKGGITIFLNGDLGAGKTALVRGFLRGLGHQGPVKSPTYTLVEPYHFASLDAQSGLQTIYHFDLYRLGHPEELEYLGIRDYFESATTALIEWPERGAGMLPTPDLNIQIDYLGEGRHVTITSRTTCGVQLLSCLSGSGDNGRIG